MPISTNLNINPYYDDYETEAKANGYVRILYKPTTAIQARELTQSQDILQDQIERFGNWSFKSGDIVTGCAINDIPSLPYVYLSDFQTNGAFIPAANLIGTVAISSANLQASVIYASQGLAVNYPNTSAVYLQYINTGTDGSTIFPNTGALTFVTTNNNVNTTIATVNVYPNTVINTFTTGNAHAISVSSGIFYMHGLFIEITDSLFALVNSYGTFAGNKHVGFKVTENIITAAQDSNLLDGSLGYSNYNAPGADRLQVVPGLVVLDPYDVANTPGFTSIVTYSQGYLSIIGTQNDIDSALGAAVAERIYEENGNFVVNPFPVDTVTTLPANSIIQFPDANTIFARVGPGVGYAGGYRVEIQKMQYANIPRATDTASLTQQTVSFNYGGYFILEEVAGTFPVQNSGTVYFYDTQQNAVTNYKFGSITTPSGNLIGNASCRCLTYNQGTPGTNTCQYFLHIFNPQMANGINVNQILSVYSNTGGANGVGDLVKPGIIGAGGEAGALMMFGFGANALANLRDSSNNNTTQYTFKRSANVVLQTNGSCVVTLTSSATGGTNIFPYANYVGQTLPQSYVSRIALLALANTDSAVLPGLVNCSSTNTSIIGNPTTSTFTSTFVPGDQLKCNGNSTIRTVVSVTNSSYLTIDAVFPVTGTAQTIQKSYIAGKVIPIVNSVSGGPNGYVTVTNSTSIAMSTGHIPSAPLNCTVIHDVLRTSVTPASKVINKGRFVKIDTTTNPKGPWSLGIPDVHTLTGVWAFPTSVSVGLGVGLSCANGINALSYFTADYGATDDFYKPASLYCTGFDCTKYPYLLIQLDHFTCNTSAGIGLFHCESYPIDDSNPDNIKAITTANITSYTDICGLQRKLRDYVDFRPYCSSTATDTGFCNSSSSTATITAAITAATINPANTITIQVPTTGMHVPSYGANLQASITYYLPRQDVIYIMPSGEVGVQTGSPSTDPQTPNIPDKALTLAALYVAPYPSLTIDQLDSLAALNQNTLNINRDTSTAVITQLTQQRRFTMHDIGVIDQRLTTLENFIALNWLEREAMNQVITNSNGHALMKSGIFTCNFSDFTACDLSNWEYSAAIDTRTQVCRPRVLVETIFFNAIPNVDNYPQALVVDRCATIPYQEVGFISQPYTSGTISANKTPYSWIGNMTVYPSYNCLFDAGNCGSISITTSNTTTPVGVSAHDCVYGYWNTKANSVAPIVYPSTLSQQKPTYNQTVDKSTLYQAVTSNPENPPQYYVQGHQSLTSNSTCFSQPLSKLDSKTIKSSPSYGKQGDGVVNSVPHSRG